MSVRNDRDRTPDLSPMQKETIILQAKTEGCGGCQTPLVNLATGAMQHIRWVRDASTESGFLVFCQSCFAKWWNENGEANQAP